MDDISDTKLNETEATDINPAQANLVKEIQKRIRADKAYHKDAFARMTRDMHVARHGATEKYPTDFYKANIAGRHVKQKTAALYAKNPKAIARRRETLDFTVWDEDPKSLQLAMQTVVMAQQQMAGMPLDPMTGAPMIDENDAVMQQAMQAFQQAQTVVADFQQGMARRQEIQKIGKTLEILFAQALREQKPVEFKVGMKKMVRRACTTGVGYVELAFQREYGPRPEMSEKLSDFRARLDHLRVLTERVSDDQNPLAADDAEIAELEHGIAALQSEPEVVLREGLIIDFPQSTKVIPDKLCRELVGFVGARHLTIEYTYTPDQVREVFGVDLQNGFRGYAFDGSPDSEEPSPAIIDDERDTKPVKGGDLVCVWKHYDKTAGVVYYLADGWGEFLREPSAPDVFVEDFWPVYALTFNDVENEKELFPISDVGLILDMQHDYNLSRQGMREHRQAGRPRFVANKGALEEQDVQALATAGAFSVKELNLTPGTKIGDILQAVPVPGVDQNLYSTDSYFTDIQLTVGSSESQMGGISQATATANAIAASASASSDGASIDDVDSFLTTVSRASGQILLREMSEEQVKAVVGPGAVWPNLTLAEISDELFLEVQAGSTGKPNQAVEVNNWKEILPFLLQMPGISPTWIARETLRRLDDKADLTEALSQDMPSIMAQNGMAQLSTGDPATDPNAQGPAGSQNAPTENPQGGGSSAAFGSNQV